MEVTELFEVVPPPQGPILSVRELQRAGKLLFAAKGDEPPAPEELEAARIAAGAQERAFVDLREMMGDSAYRHKRETPPSAHTAAVMIAVQDAALRRVRWRCRHVHWPPELPDERIEAVLSSRTATCSKPACRFAVMALSEDDGRCEVCEAETGWFTPVATAIGPVTVHLEACDTCGAFLTGRDVASEHG